MKVYVIQRIGYEYNDEYCHRPECDGGTPIKAYRVRENADAECRRLNEEKARMNVEAAYPDTDADGDPLSDFFEVVAVDLEEDDLTAAGVSYTDARERVKAAREEALRVAREAFHEGAKSLFEALPDLESFGWTQYTPYFNDGDTCYFSARTDCPYINGEYCEDVEYDNGREWVPGQGYVKVREPDAYGKMLAAVQEFLDQFDEDDLEAMFGDHVQVTVHRSGDVTTDKHGHD